MRRIRLTVAYDGTNYVGWQVQPNGVSIEEILNRELSRMLKEKITVIGASRTDSGVHARGNICVFDTESRIPGDKFKFAIIRDTEKPRICESTHMRGTLFPAVHPV